MAHAHPDSPKAFFYLPAPIAGAIGGLIAYGVGKNLDGSHGISSWRWLFLVEGVPTIFWGLLILVFLPKFPETVSKHGSLIFKTEEEREMIFQRTKIGTSKLHFPP